MKMKISLVMLWIVTMIWGLGFVLSDIALTELTPVQFLFLRFIIAAAVFAVVLRRKILTITAKEWQYGLTLGVILFLSFYLQTIGLQYTTPSKNAFLTALYVVLVPVFAYLIERKRIGLFRGACALLAVFGSGIMSLNEQFRPGIGDALTVACAFAFALQIYLTDLYVKKVRVEILVFMQMSVTAVICFFLALPEGIRVPHQPPAITAVLLSGFLSTAACYFLQSRAQLYVNESTSALVLSLEAVFGMLFSVLIVHEEVTLRMLAGGAVIMTAVFLTVAYDRKRNKGL